MAKNILCLGGSEERLGSSRIEHLGDNSERPEKKRELYKVLPLLVYKVIKV